MMSTVDMIQLLRTIMDHHLEATSLRAHGTNIQVQTSFPVLLFLLMLSTPCGRMSSSVDSLTTIISTKDLRRRLNLRLMRHFRRLCPSSETH